MFSSSQQTETQGEVLVKLIFEGLREAEVSLVNSVLFAFNDGNMLHFGKIRSWLFLNIAVPCELTQNVQSGLILRKMVM